MDKKEAVETLLIADSAVTSTAPATSWFRRLRGNWRTTVRLGAVGAACVLALNISLLEWARRHGPAVDGIVTVFSGSCKRSKTVTLWADLAINILSTVLLAASNHAAQLLSLPTREDINKAHSKRIWLDVGVASVRNLFHIPAWRSVLWFILYLSSVPLHLLYNSAVFSTLYTVDYQAALVTEDFLAGGWWNVTRAVSWNVGSTPDTEQLQQMQRNVSSLTRLDNEDCLKAYAASASESKWSNVLLVTSLELQDTLINVFEFRAPGYTQSVTWPCIGQNASIVPGGGSCDFHSLIQEASDWTLHDQSQCQGVCQHYGIGVGCPPASPNACTLVNGSVYFDVPIEYCLAQSFPGQCTVRMSTWILEAVIACNAAKLLCLLILGFCRYEPIATIGDAIASFLQRPDVSTIGAGALSSIQVKRHWQESSVIKNPQAGPFRRKKRRWGKAVEAWRWISCLVLSVVGLSFAAGFLGTGISTSEYFRGKSASAIGAQGVGVPNVANRIQTADRYPLLVNVVKANAPQLIVTFIYLLYNNVLTSMLMLSEYTSYAKRRKPLRVSRPTHEQVSTYWLQIPLLYGLPLMASMAVLHWLMSRSIFVMQIDVYDIYGRPDPSRVVDTDGYSILAMILALSLAGVLVLALIALAFRRLDDGMPVAAPCSIAIAAACHSPRGEEDGLEVLQYGVMAEQDADEAGRLHVGFSARFVTPLEDCVSYG